MKQLAGVLKKVFGWGILIVLFAGGFSFFGYFAALLMGGPMAETICTFIYKVYYKYMIYAATTLILIGLLSMYLAGEMALVPVRKKESGEKE